MATTCSQGRMAAVLVTAGAGITNALTGVVGSWADSVPVLILSGQEATKQFKNKNLARMIGIQGVYVESIYKTCTKSVVTCQDPEQVLRELANAYHIAKTDRSGPCIVDIPIDLQAACLSVEQTKWALSTSMSQNSYQRSSLSCEDLKNIIIALQKSQSPLLWLGNGLRRLAPNVLRGLIKDLNIPYLTSWTGHDLFSPIEELYAGHAGTYGGRAGNLMLQSCDLLVTIGTRLAIPQKGYIDDEIAREAKIFVIDCDPIELDKLGPRFSNKYLADAPTALSQIHESVQEIDDMQFATWRDHLRNLRLKGCHW